MALQKIVGAMTSGMALDPTSLSGNALKYLQVNSGATGVQWAVADALPAMGGHANHYLQVNAGATAAAWVALNALPDMTGHGNQFLQLNSGATAADWTSSLVATALSFGDANATITCGTGTTNRTLTIENSNATGKCNVTIDGDLTAAKVYNAVYNDYAEYFEKDEELEAGDVVAMNIDGDGYIKATAGQGELVVGVVSSPDQYAHCIGGDAGKTPEEQEATYAPISMAGRVRVKVVGLVEKGDLLVASDIPGVACACDDPAPGTIIGKALGWYDSPRGDDEVGLVRMLIMLA